MKKAEAADVKAKFATFLSESSKVPVVIMSDGKPIAVLVGVHDEDELDRLIFASSRRLHEILEAGRKDVREGRGIPREEFWNQVETERPAAQGKSTKEKSEPCLSGMRVPRGVGRTRSAIDLRPFCFFSSSRDPSRHGRAASACRTAY